MSFFILPSTFLRNLTVIGKNQKSFWIMIHILWCLLVRAKTYGAYGPQGIKQISKKYKKLSVKNCTFYLLQSISMAIQ
jgi:hypothetical protein